MFREGSALTIFPDRIGLLTPADRSEIILQNSYEIPGAILLNLILKKCDQANLPTG